MKGSHARLAVIVLGAMLLGGTARAGSISAEQAREALEAARAGLDPRTQGQPFHLEGVVELVGATGDPITGRWTWDWHADDGEREQLALPGAVVTLGRDARGFWLHDAIELDVAGTVAAMVLDALRRATGRSELFAAEVLNAKERRGTLRVYVAPRRRDRTATIASGQLHSLEDDRLTVELEPAAPASDANAGPSGGLVVSVSRPAGEELARVAMKPPTIGAATSPGCCEAPDGARRADDVLPSQHPLLTPPRVVHQVEPEYPASLRRGGIRGVVVLRAIIGTDGAVEAVEVLEGAHPQLDESALAATRQRRYEPGRVAGHPVRTDMTVTVSFGTR